MCNWIQQRQTHPMLILDSSGTLLIMTDTNVAANVVPLVINISIALGNSININSLRSILGLKLILELGLDKINVSSIFQVDSYCHDIVHADADAALTQ